MCSRYFALWQTLHLKNLEERRYFLTCPLGPFSQITAALSKPLVDIEFQSIWESVNLREYRQLKTINQNVLCLNDQSRKRLSWAAGVGVKDVYLFSCTEHIPLITTLLDKDGIFSWKRDLNIFKNLYKFFALSPDFDSLAHEEL